MSREDFRSSHRANVRQLSLGPLLIPPLTLGTLLLLARNTAKQKLLLLAHAIASTADDAVVLTQATLAVTSLTIRLVMAALVLHSRPPIHIALELLGDLALGTVPQTRARPLTREVIPAPVVGSTLLAVVLLPSLLLPILALMRPLHRLGIKDRLLLALLLTHIVLISYHKTPA